MLKDHSKTKHKLCQENVIFYSIKAINFLSEIFMLQVVQNINVENFMVVDLKRMHIMIILL
jgi:hypothetical protein